jgi:predicted Fe-Mo cluster-binding NifX family protein
MNKKIAIPSSGENVNAHFGRSQAFTIFEVQNGKMTGEEVIDTKGFEHQHAGIAQHLKSKGVEIVICGGIGPGAITGLENAGLEVLRGASGLARNVVESYVNGTFVSSNAVCNHSHGHHHENHHDHDHHHHND